MSQAGCQLAIRSTIAQLSLSTWTVRTSRTPSYSVMWAARSVTYCGSRRGEEEGEAEDEGEAEVAGEGVGLAEGAVGADERAEDEAVGADAEEELGPADQGLEDGGDEDGDEEAALGSGWAGEMGGGEVGD